MPQSDGPILTNVASIASSPPSAAAYFPLISFYLAASTFYFPRCLVSAFCSHSSPRSRPVSREEFTHSSAAVRYLSGNTRSAVLSSQDVSSAGNRIKATESKQQNQGNRMHRSTMTSWIVGVGCLRTLMDRTCSFQPTHTA